jgi:hypothetical protein
MTTTKKDPSFAELRQCRSTSAWLLAATAGVFAASFAAAALCSWSATALIALLWALLILAHWLAGRAEVEKLAQRNLLAPYLKTLPAIVSELRESAEQLEGAVLQACDGFDGIRVEARARRRGDDLEGEILSVIVALQFHDIVNQRLDHAIETLTRLTADVSACVGDAPEGASADIPLNAPAPADATTNEFATAYCTAKKHAPAEKADVEIFVPEVAR